jgi:hypothetical protein
LAWLDKKLELASLAHEPNKKTHYREIIKAKEKV